MTYRLYPACGTENDCFGHCPSCEEALAQGSAWLATGAICQHGFVLFADEELIAWLRSRRKVELERFDA